MIRWLSILCLAAFMFHLAHSQERMSSLVGVFKKFPDLPSKYLPSKHNVTVWLPPDYERDRRRRFPVLYLGDGQNLFDGKLSFLPNKEWRVDETADAMIRASLIEPILIVGIDNAGTERANEYLPSQSKIQGQEVGGRAKDFLQMMVNEIKPMIDEKFRTKAGASNCAIGGSSFGGIMALYVALQRPDVFGKVVSCSPSAWWDDNDIVRRFLHLKSRPNLKIWVDMGTAEGAQMLSASNSLASALAKIGMRPGKDFVYYVERDAVHNEDAWANRAPMFLQFLFGT